MAGAISSPLSTPHNLPFHISTKFPSSLNPCTLKNPCFAFPFAPFPSNGLFRFSDSVLCRCQNNGSPPSSDDSISWRWDLGVQDFVKNAIKKFDSYVSLVRKEVGDSDGFGGGGGGVLLGGSEREGEGKVEEWDWDRWKKHFDEVDEQERLVSILKSQLGDAVYREDYDDAARLKVAIAAAATNDTVGGVIYRLNRAIAEERYQDAAFIRDNTGAGLVGWWAGISENLKDSNGLIIRITAEHGRYVARSYSPRQLATDAAGVPLFEIYLTINKKGQYKQKAVYLKQRGFLKDSPVSSKASGLTSHLNPSDSTEDKTDLFVESAEDAEDGDDTDDNSDLAEGFSGFQNILRDMIPGVKVKVLKVTAPGKVDRDMISKVIEQIMEEEDEEEEDIEVEIIEGDDEVKVESDQEKSEAKINAGGEFVDNKDHSEIAVKVILSGLVQKLSSTVAAKELLRIPAKLEKKGRLSFSFSIEKEVNQDDSGDKEQALLDRKRKLVDQRSLNHVMLDLAKFVGTEKVPSKVLKDVGELINLTLTQAQNYQPLSGSTTFNRIEIPASSDPLSGLYIGLHGMYSSEVIHLSRKFGQWQENDGIKEPSNLEFYEYVEALKLAGDPYVPAGQVAFRAKIGKRYQLPHKGIIPEEFGVIARYRGQGRLAGPGFKNPRWVDGELVILDGKYIKGGPVVGFVYWAPEYHFLVFFNRLRLQQ